MAAVETTAGAAGPPLGACVEAAEFFTASAMVWPIAMPAPSPAPMPTAPPPSFAAAIGMDCATSYWVNLPMSPITFMLMRWSRTFCSSSGSERFSTLKVSSEMPYSDAIEIAGAANFTVKSFGVGEVVGINAEAAEADRAEFFVADSDGVRRAPVLISLRARREKIDVGFEGRLEGFIPIFEIGENRQGLRVERIQTGTEGVREFSFVDEHRELRVAHCEFAAVLDFAILHGVAVSENTVLGLDPVDDVDKLFGNKIAKAHDTLFLRGDSIKTLGTR